MTKTLVIGATIWWRGIVGDWRSGIYLGLVDDMPGYLRVRASNGEVYVNVVALI